MAQITAEFTPTRHTTSTVEAKPTFQIVRRTEIQPEWQIKTLPIRDGERIDSVAVADLHEVLREKWRMIGDFSTMTREEYNYYISTDVGLEHINRQDLVRQARQLGITVDENLTAKRDMIGLIQSWIDPILNDLPDDDVRR